MFRSNSFSWILNHFFLQLVARSCDFSDLRRARNPSANHKEVIFDTSVGWTLITKFNFVLELLYPQCRRSLIKSFSWIGNCYRIELVAWPHYKIFLLLIFLWGFFVFSHDSLNDKSFLILKFFLSRFNWKLLWLHVWKNDLSMFDCNTRLFSHSFHLYLLISDHGFLFEFFRVLLFQSKVFCC